MPLCQGHNFIVTIHNCNTIDNGFYQMQGDASHGREAAPGVLQRVGLKKYIHGSSAIRSCIPWLHSTQGFRQCTVLKLLFTFLALTAQRRHLQSAALQHRPRLQTGPSCCRPRPARPTAGTYPAAEDCTCRMQNAAQRCIKSRALTGMHPEELGVSSSQKIKLLELTVECQRKS